MKQKLLVISLFLIFITSCSSGEYVYKKSKCACMPLINHADIKHG